MKGKVMHKFVELLHREVVPAQGCTEPIAVAYAVSIAAEQQESPAEHIELYLSGNIVKNALGVGIPGTGRIGIDIAALLGAVLRRQTIVTKGPLFTAHSEKGRVTVIFDNTSGYLDWAPAQAAAPVLELRDSTGAVQRAETDLRTPLSLSLAPGARSAVLKLYAGACAPVHLLAVGAPLYLDKEGNG